MNNLIAQIVINRDCSKTLINAEVSLRLSIIKTIFAYIMHLSYKQAHLISI